MEEEKPEINTVEESETAKNEDKDTEPVENNEADVAKDSGDTDNREEDAKTELRFLVPNRCAGALIGKGGERIKKLHVTYNADLRVADRKMPERVFCMSISQNKFIECLTEILDLLRDFREMKNDRGEMSIRILVHQSAIGALFGRGGETIKELRKKLDAAIKIFNVPLPASTDRVMRISAAKDRLPTIIKSILEHIKAPQCGSYYDNENQSGSNMAHFRGQKRAYHDQFDNYQHKRPYNAPAQRAQDPYNRYQVWNAEREYNDYYRQPPRYPSNAYPQEAYNRGTEGPQQFYRPYEARRHQNWY